MSKCRLFLLALFAFAQAVHADPVHLRTNSLDSPLGIDTPRPTFSWQSNARTPNWMQSAYEVLIATDAKNLLPGNADAWDSGRIDSSESVNITYGGAALKSQQRYFWKVISWDDEGAQTISAPAWFETGLLTAADWKAQWIGSDELRKNDQALKDQKLSLPPPVLLRTTSRTYVFGWFTNQSQFYLLPASHPDRKEWQKSSTISRRASAAA